MSHALYLTELPRDISKGLVDRFDSSEGAAYLTSRFIDSTPVRHFTESMPIEITLTGLTKLQTPNSAYPGGCCPDKRLCLDIFV